MTTTPGPVPATKYRVTWENGRIGRTHDNEPTVFEADSPDHLSEVIFRHVRTKLASRDVNVSLELPDGPGDDTTGVVLCGFHVGARFTVETVDDPDAEAPRPVMSVRVRDREAEKLPSGSWTAPVVRAVDIPTTCRTCGGPRGIPKSKREYDDGDWYTVDVWTNPCGHVDDYVAVLHEAGVR